MNILTNRPLAKKLHFDSDTMWIILEDGRELGIPLAYFPRLMNASPELLEKYTISGGGTGLHWDELDEDILVKNLLLGMVDFSADAHKFG